MEPRTWFISDQEQLDRLAAFLPKLGNRLPLDIEARPHKKIRTIAQNKRLWDLHTLASDATGYTKDEMHELALCKHYGYAERECKNPITGEVEYKKDPLKRSSTRDTAEFSKFMEATEIFYANELGIFLP